MADKSNDPVAMWQNMIGEMEKGFNSFANQAMASPEFSKVVNQVGGVDGGCAKAARRPHGKISRQHEPAEPGADGRHGRAAAVDREPVERDQGDAAPDAQQLAAPADGYGTPRPPRTKRPPSAEGEKK